MPRIYFVFFIYSAAKAFSPREHFVSRLFFVCQCLNVISNLLTYIWRELINSYAMKHPTVCFTCCHVSPLLIPCCMDGCVSSCCIEHELVSEGTCPQELRLWFPFELCASSMVVEFSLLSFFFPETYCYPFWSGHVPIFMSVTQFGKVLAQKHNPECSFKNTTLDCFRSKTRIWQVWRTRELIAKKVKIQSNRRKNFTKKNK